MNNEDFKLIKEQLKNLESTVKTYENHIFMLQGDLQYTQKAFQMEQSKMHAQIGNLVGLIFDVVKENRHYEESRETQILQKLNQIMSASDEYSALNNALSTTSSSIPNDANSLINGTIASLTSNTASGGSAGTILSSSTRMNANDQLLTPTSLQAQNQMLSQQPQQIQQQLQQQAQLNAVQKNYQQIQNQHQNQVRLQQQQQQHQQGHHHQHQQHQHQQQQQQQVLQSQQPQSSQQQTPQQTQLQQQQIQRHSLGNSLPSQAQAQNQNRHSINMGGVNQPHNSNPVHFGLQDPTSDTPVDAPAQKRRKPSSNANGMNSTSNSNTRDNRVRSSNTEAAALLDVPLNINGTQVVPISMDPSAAAEPTKDKNIPRKVYDKEYAFIKAPSSVEEIWDEYAVGLNGQPSIKSLEMEFKTGWRRDPATSKKFNRRKAIYHAIEKGLSKGFSVEMCIRMLEDYRYLDRDKNLKQPIGWLCHGNVPDELR